MCNCGHDAVHDEQGCTYGRGTAFGGCKCPKVHGRRGPRARKFVSPPEGTLPANVVLVAFSELEQDVQRAIRKFREAVLGGQRTPAPVAPTEASARRELAQALEDRAGRERAQTVSPAPRPLRPELPKGVRKCLIVIAQHPLGVDRPQIVAMTGFALRTVQTYVQATHGQDMTRETGGIITISPAGKAAIGSEFQPLPTGHALLQHWLAELPTGEAAVLETVAKSASITRSQLGELTGFALRTVQTYVQQLARRKLVLASRSTVVLSHHLSG